MENYDHESTLDHKSEFMTRITKPNYVSVKKITNKKKIK